MSDMGPTFHWTGGSIFYQMNHVSRPYDNMAIICIPNPPLHDVHSEIWSIFYGKEKLR